MPNRLKMNTSTQKKQTKSSDSSLQPTFEGAMNELDGIVNHLEQDDLTLDGALTFFERGISLLRTCDAHLNQVRGRITEILKNEDGDFTEKIIGTSLESFLNKENEHD
jgi:exodeoxyribonuclease VII small subunit